MLREKKISAVCYIGGSIRIWCFLNFWPLPLASIQDLKSERPYIWNLFLYLKKEEKPRKNLFLKKPGNLPQGILEPNSHALSFQRARQRWGVPKVPTQ